MKTLAILVLLSSAMLLCSASPPLEPVTCSDDSGAAAARLAVHDINEHHDHGYKFRLSEIEGNNMEKVDDGCTIELRFNLLETVCHTVHPKHFEDCALRNEFEQAVMANCTVSVTVKSGNANVTKYDCDTRKVKTDEEMMLFCPDCPKLVPLNSPEGFPVREAVEQVNSNTTNERYYVLHEVGRITAGYMMSEGMFYDAEIVLVETHCPMFSRIKPEACKPLCPDRARHAFCRSSYTRGKGRLSVECEYYPPSNATDLGPGEKEPLCNSHPVVTGGQSPRGGHPRRARHPHHEGPHAHGPPDQGVYHHPLRPCNGFLPDSDPALHPICPMPLPEPRHDSKESQRPL